MEQLENCHYQEVKYTALKQVPANCSEAESHSQLFSLLLC